MLAPSLSRLVSQTSAQPLMAAHLIRRQHRARHPDKAWCSMLRHEMHRLAAAAAAVPIPALGQRRGGLLKSSLFIVTLQKTRSASLR